MAGLGDFAKDDGARLEAVQLKHLVQSNKVGGARRSNIHKPSGYNKTKAAS